MVTDYFWCNRFSSNYFANGLGFQLEYASTYVPQWTYRYGECGGNFTTPNGQFTSPFSISIADSYPNFANCIYTISQPPDNVIVLIFHSMDIEERYDKLEIRDGPSMNSALIGIFDGNDVPAPIQTTQSQMWIK